MSLEKTFYIQTAAPGNHPKPVSIKIDLQTRKRKSIKLTGEEGLADLTRYLELEVFSFIFRDCDVSLYTIVLSSFLAFHLVLACKCDDFKSSEHSHKDAEQNGFFLTSVSFKNKTNFVGDPLSYPILCSERVMCLSLNQILALGMAQPRFTPLGWRWCILKPNPAFWQQVANPNSYITALERF